MEGLDCEDGFPIPNPEELEELKIKTMTLTTFQQYQA